MKLLVLNWLLVLMLVFRNSYLVLIVGWLYSFSVGVSEIGFLYLYCRYILRWFCRLVLMFGRWCIRLMFRLCSRLVGLMFECCRICGEVMVLLYSSILWWVVVCCGWLLCSYCMFIVCLFENRMWLVSVWVMMVRFGCGLVRFR